MSGLKGGALLLVLGVPLAGYCALQVKSVASSETVPGAPQERSPSQQKLDGERARAAALASDARKALELAEQFRAAGPTDTTSDPAATAVVKAAAVRAADLSDLDQFLTDLESPKFTGRMKPQYEKWSAERRELRRDEQAVTDWLARPMAIHSAADAAKALEAAEMLIGKYATASRFSNTTKAAVWRVRARLVVVDALAALVDKQYRDAIAQKLPLKPNDPATVTLAALKKAVAELIASAKTAEIDTRLDPALRKAVDAQGAVADESAARDELLSLFARDDLFTNSTGAASWLKEVAAKYSRTKSATDRALIRRKVQEFCDAFIPREVRLDDKVLFNDKEIDRKEVVVRFLKSVGSKVMRIPLSGELEGVNEFNLAKIYPGPGTLAEAMAAQTEPRFLKPTELSKTSVFYSVARKRLADGGVEPKWTAKSAEELKKACEPQKDRVDKLEVPGAGSRGMPPRIWTRLSGLVDGMDATPELFGTSR